MNTGDGPDPDANYAILNRGKRHDYFTSCLPWPQKGPAVTLPLGSTAPVKRDTALLHGGQFLKPGGIMIPVAGNVTQSAVPNLTVGGDVVSYDPRGTLYADLSQATAATINAIRTAFQVQKLLDAHRAAGGDVRFYFQDVGWELPETYAYLPEVVQAFGPVQHCALWVPGPDDTKPIIPAAKAMGSDTF